MLAIACRFESGLWYHPSLNSSMRVTLSLLLFTMLLAAATSNAQSLETVVVTAERQARDYPSVANNTGLLSYDNIQRVAHTHINEALARVPGVWVSRGNGQEHLTAIRSPVLTGAGACGAFLMAEDGLALRAAGFCNLNQLFEVNSEQAHSIEVVRGPQSALYGSNAVHGIINVLSYGPPNRAQTDLAAEFGPDDYYRVKAAQSLQFGEHALRLYGNGTSDGGYKHESGFDQHKLNLSHYYQGGTFSIKNHLSVTKLNQETAGFIQGLDAYKDEALKRSNPNPEAFRDAEALRFYSQIQLQLSDDLELQMRPYLRSADMRFLQHFLPWQSLEENGVDSLGMQFMLRRAVGAAELRFGLDLEYSEGYLLETQAEPFSPTLPAGVHYDYNVDAQLVSPFISTRLPLGRDTELVASLRFDSTEYDYRNNTGGNSACAPGVQGCRFTPPDSRSNSFNDWSPSLAVVHSLSDSHSLYAKAARGFRAPQATELYRLQAGQQVSDLDSEQMDSIEFGWRSAFGKLQFVSSLYHMRKQDFIFQDTDRRNISGGESTHTGIELDLTTQLREKLSLMISGTYARHRYANSIRISNIDIDGNDIDTAPRYSGNVRLLWQPNERSDIELEWLRLGSYFQNPENTAKYSGHDLVNLRASTRLGKHWQLGLRLVNALDSEYAERADFAFGNHRYFVGTPRSLYFSIRYQH